MKTDSKERCTNCIHMAKVKRESNKLQHNRVCLCDIKHEPWKVLNLAGGARFYQRIVPCHLYQRQTADLKSKVSLDEFIAEYFAPTKDNLLPKGFAAAIQELSLKEAVQLRAIITKGALTALLGWKSESDKATAAAVQQALNAVEQIIENKANEE